MAMVTSRHISHDPVSNLRVKVRLKRITSTSVLGNIAETFANPASTGQDIELMPRNEEAGATEEATVSWQEKILSQREIELYGDAINCNTVRERHYHEVIEGMRERNEFHHRRIYTCVEEDPAVSDKENIPLTSRTSQALSYLEHKMRQARPAGRKQNYTPLQHPVQVPSSDVNRKSNHVQLVAAQRMYIMADIGRPRGLPRVEDEAVLCAVTMDTNHVLSVTPPLNSGDAHSIENSDGDVWEYTVEQVVQEFSDKDKVREHEVLEELFSRHASMLHNMVGTSFTDPPQEGAERVHVFGEIARAVGFDADNLFVNYSFDLPLGWCVEEDVEMRGLTQRSIIRETKSGQIAHFNHPFELTLFNSTSKDEEMGGRPRLFVEVRSVDSWDRVRLEGYGYLTLPNTTGCHTHTLNTWRPEGPDNTTKLRRFFVGGTPELSDVRYTHVPSNYNSHPDQSTLLGKFGFKTVSSGTVEVRVNIVKQTMPSFTEDNQKYKRVALKDKYGRPGVQMALLDAIETFSKARKRLESMRTTLEPSLSRLASNISTEQSIIKRWSKLTFSKE
ncbi:tectonic-like complex member MKS1 [Bolinopsis microptera]|uniref:tectonic-like complex member MKS1 n=1 Tax=Bolinopsis microptera TaxID=2820187 RepID=UPI00307A6FF7